MDDLLECFEPVREICRKAGWPGVEESTSYRTPALKVRGKLLLRMKEPDVVVLRVELEEKEFLMKHMPEVYFETDHYKGWPAVLARLSQIDPDELAQHIEYTWRAFAPKKLIEQYDRRRT